MEAIWSCLPYKWRKTRGLLYRKRHCGKDLIIQKGQMRSLFSRMQGHEFLMRSVVLVLEYHYLASKRANDSLNNVCNSSSANHISTDFAKNLYSPLLSMSFLLLNQILLTTWRWKSWIVITNPERRCYLQERALQTGHPALGYHHINTGLFRKVHLFKRFLHVTYFISFRF